MFHMFVWWHGPDGAHMMLGRQCTRVLIWCLAQTGPNRRKTWAWWAFGSLGWERGSTAHIESFRVGSRSSRWLTPTRSISFSLSYPHRRPFCPQFQSLLFQSSLCYKYAKETMQSGMRLPSVSLFPALIPSCPSRSVFLFSPTLPSPARWSLPFAASPTAHESSSGRWPTADRRWLPPSHRRPSWFAPSSVDPSSRCFCFLLRQVWMSALDGSLAFAFCIPFVTSLGFLRFRLFFSEGEFRLANSTFTFTIDEVQTSWLPNLRVV